MKLSDHFESSGNWLFRWRSFLPLVVVGAALLVLRDFHFPRGTHQVQEEWVLCCLVISLVGLGLRIYTIGQVPKGTSGRNTREQVADELNTRGIYSVVRHPLYLGNYLMWVGAAATTGSAWFVITLTLAFWLYHERIIFAEEAFLERRYGERFAAWAARTPAFIPDLKLWAPAQLRFSGRHALKREYLGLFWLITVFFVLEHAEDWAATGHFHWERGWLEAWVLMFAALAVIRFLVKKTELLSVEGR